MFGVQFGARGMESLPAAARFPGPLGTQQAGAQKAKGGGAPSSPCHNQFQVVSGDVARRFRSLMPAETRPEKIREIVGSLEQGWHSKPPARKREHSQRYERAQHAPRSLVDMHLVFIKPWLALKRSENEPRHT